MSEGKLGELIKNKRAFLRQATKDYASGGNDMLDDINTVLAEAKEELMHNLELASCLKEEGQAAYEKECMGMYSTWFEKWFGKA